MILIHDIETSLLANSDPDGDSRMISSPSENGSDALFPAADDPPTPQNNDILAQLRQAELSPPSSQDPPGQNGAFPPDDMMDVAEVQEIEDSNEGGDSVGIGGSVALDKDAEKEPGYAWKNAKAREDYHRSMEQVLDKGFTLREFGDPFEVKKPQGNGSS
ncbi:MAG: hypothetical protein Q9187_008841 [Circinaria calcarea]